MSNDPAVSDVPRNLDAVIDDELHDELHKINRAFIHGLITAETAYYRTVSAVYRRGLIGRFS